MTAANNQLPSPTEVKVSMEQIWSEDTGRAQSGNNRAMMVGDSITAKLTYAMKWDILTPAQFTRLKNLLPRGFFYFGEGTQTGITWNNQYTGTPPSSPEKYYRSEITYEMINGYIKNVATTVIQQ